MAKTRLVIPSGKPVNLSAIMRQTEVDTPEADTFIVSYPKCGRTWLRSIIGKYLVLKYGIDESLLLETEEATKASNIKCTAFTHDGAAMVDQLSYLELYYSREEYKNSNVILLVRDLKDTMVSAYFQATKRMNVFDGPISEFLKSDLFGIRKLLAFYDVWAKHKHIPLNYVYVTYEDLHAQPELALADVFKLMGEEEIDMTALQASLEFNEFDNQKKREADKVYDTPIARAYNPDDPESYKARKGKVGGYTEYLTEEDEQFINDWVKQFRFDFEQLRP